MSLSERFRDFKLERPPIDVKILLLKLLPRRLRNSRFLNLENLAKFYTHVRGGNKPSLSTQPTIYNELLVLGKFFINLSTQLVFLILVLIL